MSIFSSIKDVGLLTSEALEEVLSNDYVNFLKLSVVNWQAEYVLNDNVGSEEMSGPTKMAC